VSKVPSLDYLAIIKAFQRDGWIVVRQKGSHIRLQKRLPDETLKLTVPAHRPVKRSTLAHLLKQSRLSVEDCLALLR
jgi:predicted RNA binding protein YcfA (HicA-like mRNA interferase family)